MGIQGSWCYTREIGAASILSGEPSVPGKIPGGVVCGSIPGLVASTQGGVPTVPGKIPGCMTSRPTPAGQQSVVVSLISSSIPGQVVVFVYSRGGWGRILIHTSGLAAMSILVAGKHPLSDCDGVCVTDVGWAVVWEATHSAAGWSQLSPTQWASWLGGLRRRLLSQPRVSGRAARGSRG